MTLLLNILVDGVAYGMVLFVMAVGLSITLGLMKFINLSHGAFAMAGGYGVAVLVGSHGCNFWAALLVALIATGVFGAALEALVLRHLYRRPELQQVLFTIGLTFFLVATANAIFGPQVRSISLPPSLSGSVDLGFRTLPTQRVFVLLAGVAAAALLTWIIARTRFGVWIRASVDHADAASGLGIPIRLVQCLSFGAGAALAGLGGVLGAELMPLEPYYPLKYLVLMLVVVAVGGMGSIPGSLCAALVLGTVDTASKYLVSEWGSLLFFVAMGLLLAWRPRGILTR